MNNVGEKYLPIGTVIMLKGGTKRVMITGFCSASNDDQNTMYDYSGCMYPEGFLSSDQTALFNHNQIDKIYHMGLIDQEEVNFKNQLKNLVSKVTSIIPPVGVVQPVSSTQSVSPVNTVVSEPAVNNDVPPIGPGLPGYTAPVVQPVQSNGMQFDENGVVTSIN